ncbi:MAG: VOC family protein [Alphaproteobacteria bacterium]|nr:VOC family protein [Alphaproteobacteria bacterium]
MTKPSIVGGIYEVGIGVNDLPRAIGYWERFGYRMVAGATLSADVAATLYGVNSAGRSVRLQHLDSDHGLVRLTQWEQSTGAGLGLEPLRGLGSRWSTQITSNILVLLSHAEAARNAGVPCLFDIPAFSRTGTETIGPDFPLEPIRGYREMRLLQPLWRQVVLERLNVHDPDYGRVDDRALFRTSQITHMGLIVQDDAGEKIRFYDQVLGFHRQPERVMPYERARSVGAHLVYPLPEGEGYRVQPFDDPRNADGRTRSGRLHLVRFPQSSTLPDWRGVARPGLLGYSLYTLRCADTTAMHRHVAAGGAGALTPIALDEFGQRAFSFVAPDGYFWTMIETR